ncbi:hypothetical protein D9M70_602060 [compost metagenome]
MLESSGSLRASSTFAVTGSARDIAFMVVVSVLRSIGLGRSGWACASIGDFGASASTCRAIDFKSRFPHKDAGPLRARLFLYSTTTLRIGFFIRDIFPEEV